MAIDGYRFVDLASRKVMQAWEQRGPKPDTLPWTPLGKPLSEARVALVSTAALVHVDDEPFDQDGERRNPWWGDPSHRVLSRDVDVDEVRVDHLHIDPRPAMEDLDCLMPLRRLKRLAEEGVIGSVAGRHYSFMGYHLDTTALLEQSAPEIAGGLLGDEVDLALFVPV